MFDLLMKMEVSLANVIPQSTASGTLSHRMDLSRNLPPSCLQKESSQKAILAFCRIGIEPSEPGVAKLLTQNLLTEMEAEGRCDPSLGLGP